MDHDCKQIEYQIVPVCTPYKSIKQIVFVTHVSITWIITCGPHCLLQWSVWWLYCWAAASHLPVCPYRQPSCCPSYLFAWSLPLIIINKYNDMIFTIVERAREHERERKGMRERKRVHRKRNCLSSVVCILFMSLTYSTDTNI